MLLLQNVLRKIKKRKLQKVWMQCDKSGVFKAKGFRKRETATKKDKCLFMMIIVFQDNKMES